MKKESRQKESLGRILKYMKNCISGDQCNFNLIHSDSYRRCH